MRDCSEFAYSVLNKYEDLDNYFMLSTVASSVQKAESNESDSCINYINHEEQSKFNSRMVPLTEETQKLTSCFVRN